MFYDITKGYLEDSKVQGSPWYLSLDGTLLIIKDRDEEFADMTKEQKQLYSRKSYGGSAVSSYWRQEPNLVIKVKKQEQESTEPQQNNQESNEV